MKPMVDFAHNHRLKLRVCLKCDKQFNSNGPGNRICGKCQKINAKYDNLPEALLAKERGVKRHNGEVIECD